jgi:hypothetical protein
VEERLIEEAGGGETTVAGVVAEREEVRSER